MGNIMRMRIAVPASGPSVYNSIDSRFGKAPFIILVTLETGSISCRPNPFAQNNGGIEPRFVEFLIKNQVSHLISSRISDHVICELQAAGILVFFSEESGLISSVLEQFNAGKLILMAKKAYAS